MPFTKQKPFKPEEMPCISAEHNPPTHMYLEPGRYTWKWPMRGKEVSFTVPAVIA